MVKTGILELEAVLAVARHRGFRPAARELEISPSALTALIAGLEEKLDIRLFNRTTRSVSLTEAGERFVARLAPPLAEIRSAIAEANDKPKSPIGTLRINASIGAIRMIFANIVLEYRHRYPQVTMDIVTEGAFVDIVRGGYDAGIRLSEMVPRDMVRVLFGDKLRMAVVGTPKYFESHGKPNAPADLARHECIRSRSPGGTVSRWDFFRRGESISVDPPGTFILDNPSLMRQAALADLGLAYLSEWQVRDDVKNGRLVQVLEQWIPAIEGLALYFPKGRHTPAPLRALIDLIQEKKR